MFFSDSHLSLELLGIFKLKRGKCQQKTSKTRTYDSLSIRIDGCAYFEADNKKIKVTPSDVLYIPKSCCYSQATEEETILAIHFINYSFNKANRIELLAIEDAKYIKSLIFEMYETWKEQAIGYRYRCISLFYNLIYYLNQQSIEYCGKRTNDSLKVALDYIHANYRTEEIKISELAKMCAFSETYFRRAFKDIYKISPLEYIINLKLEYASQLLQSKLYTICEISEKSGFSDSKYFSRIFKKKYGISPVKYKNMDLETEWK